MKLRHVLFLLVLLGGLGHGSPYLLAQALPPLPPPPPSEETSAFTGAPPTPQLLQVEVDLQDGLGVRVRRHPAWIALSRPALRVNQARSETPAEPETAAPLNGGAEQLQQALGQALQRAQPQAPPP